MSTLVTRIFDGARARAAREAAGLTQSQLADLVQVSSRQIRRVELGERVASADLAAAWADACNVALDDLFSPPRNLIAKAS